MVTQYSILARPIAGYPNTVLYVAQEVRSLVQESLKIVRLYLNF